MKKILFCLSFVAMVFVGQANASDIAIIDLDQVIKNSTAMSKINKDLEAKKNAVEKKLKVEEQKLTNEKTTLESQVKTLSQEKAQEKVMAFQQKVMDFQKMVKDNESQLQKTYMDSVIEITNTIKTIVIELKTEKGDKYSFDVVLPSASVIYSEKSLDISSEVLSRLNKRLKEVKLNKK